MKSSFNGIKVSLIINYIIIVFVLFATVVMFTGFKFMHGMEPVLESSTFGMFRFYTVDSNLLMGLAALLFVREERKLLTGKIKTIPLKYYILKLMATVSVGLTFIVVFAYLGRISNGGIMSLLMNSNLFFHLIVPVLSIITFSFFEKTDKIKFKHVFFGIIPTIIYGIYYVINVSTHVVDGKVSPKYDWYYFAQKGLNQAYIVASCIIMITLVITIILYFINHNNK